MIIRKRGGSVFTGPSIKGSDVLIVVREITIEASTYGLFFCLAINAIYSILCSKSDFISSRTRQVLLSLILVLLAVSTTHIILTVTNLNIQLPTIDSPDPAYSVSRIMNRLLAGQQVIERVNYLISDAIVVWRAWVFFNDNFWVRMYLAVALLATAVTSIILAVFNVLFREHGRDNNTFEENMLGTFSLLATNVSATALVAYKAWQYRLEFKGTFYTSNTRVILERVFALLIESGALYIMFWVLMMISDFGYTDSFGFEFDWFQPHVSGIYVTAVILMLAKQTASLEDLTTKYGRNDFDTTVDIEFALQNHTSSSEPSGYGADNSRQNGLNEAALGSSKSRKGDVFIGS